MDSKSAHEHEADVESGASAQPDPVAVLEAEKLELKDKLLRTLADMENLRRRTEREISDAKTYAVTGFARDMLSVADNLRRALESLGVDAANSADAADRKSTRLNSSHSTLSRMPSSA